MGEPLLGTGVCVLLAFLDDFLVSGLWSILCFHSNKRLIDSSLWNE